MPFYKKGLIFCRNFIIINNVIKTNILSLIINLIHN